MVARKGFTLIELLVTLTILVFLMIAVVYKLKPIQLFYQAQDAERVSDIVMISKSVSLYYDDAISNPKNLNLGSSSILYTSLLDPLATSTAGDQCQGLDLPPLNTTTGYSYHCAASSTLTKTDGTGWIPVNFDSFSGGTFLDKLPVDPVNESSSALYYIYVTDGRNYEIVGNLESDKYQSASQSDGGRYPYLYEKGTSLALLPINYAPDHYVFIVDNGNNRVEKFDPSGDYLSQFGSYGTGNGQFNQPFGITLDSSGNIYVTDKINNRVEKFDANGNYLSQFGTAGSGNGQFNHPVGITIDANNNIYITDSGNCRVEKFDANGNYISQFGSCGNGNGQFGEPGPDGITIDASGAIYVADSANGRVEKFDANGNYLSQFGSGYFGPYYSPEGIVFDSSGNSYVLDTYNSRVEKFDANGNYISQFSSNLNDPDGIAIDSSGNIYVTNVYYLAYKFDANGNYISQFGYGRGAGSENGQLDEPAGIVIQ